MIDVLVEKGSVADDAATHDSNAVSAARNNRGRRAGMRRAFHNGDVSWCVDGGAATLRQSVVDAGPV